MSKKISAIYNCAEIIGLVVNTKTKIWFYQFDRIKHESNIAHGSDHDT